MVTKAKRAAYLRRYINSLGVELPPDYGEYEEGSIFQRECVFCAEPHNNIPVYRYEPIGQVREATGCHACNDCSDMTNTMVRDNYPQLFSEDVDQGRTIDFDESDWGNRRYKINLYNTTQQFDNTVKHYLVHKSDPNLQCYFCGQRAVTVDEELLVPVTDSHELSGGRVKICQSCNNELWEGAKDPQQDLEQKCSYCGGVYLVTRDEFDRRHLNKTVGKHMCPECTYGGIVQEQSKFSPLNDKVNESEPFFRFVYKSCNVCGTSFSIDLTLLHSKLIQIHEFKQGIRCLLCYQFKIEDERTKQVFEVEDLYAVIVYIDKHWIYRLSRIINNEEKIMFRPPSDYRVSNIIDCIEDAVNAASSLGKQAEFDYG